ncbi:NADH-ubiquinone oxidoreductase complex I, 21 kDa subunit-domain-containing protein [Globomyces pollinis-pini]|nr:NADH-ubiquinone oxidoreductase complex I, 21 kDa subunit-domain-containing protein [Globomyces pollinis-pini]
MKWVSNLPDSNHTPYPVLEEEPHLKKVVAYFRPSDYATIAAFTTVFPGALYLSEMRSPNLHPKLLPKVLAVQIPFFFAAGVLFATQNTYFRFWGWKENDREVKRFKNEEPTISRNSKWSQVDW